LDNELEVLHQCLSLLKKLEKPAQLRSLQWLTDRLSEGHMQISEQKKAAPPSAEAYKLVKEPLAPEAPKALNSVHICSKFGNINDILAFCQPKTDADKVLIATAWYQHNRPEMELTGRFINDSLKKIGKDVKNITSTLLLLEKRSPAQVASSSNRKNSRKIYRVTEEGFKYVAAQYEN